MRALLILLINLSEDKDSRVHRLCFPALGLNQRPN